MEAFISSTNRLEGAEWSSVGNPTGSDDSFDSQPALVWPYTDTTTNQTYNIYMGDRWAAPNLLCDVHLAAHRGSRQPHAQHSVERSVAVERPLPTAAAAWWE